MPTQTDATEPVDLYIFRTTVEGVYTELSGKTYIKLHNLQGRFCVTAPVILKVGDKVKLSFHKDEDIA